MEAEGNKIRGRRCYNGFEGGGGDRERRSVGDLEKTEKARKQLLL